MEESKGQQEGSEGQLVGSESQAEGCEGHLSGLEGQPGRNGWMDKLTYGQTEVLPILQDFVPCQGRWPKRKEIGGEGERERNSETERQRGRREREFTWYTHHYLGKQIAVFK